jgi:hypothetical protein
MINGLSFTNLGDVYYFCIDDVGVVCNELGETIVFFDNDDVDVFFDNVDVNADFDAEVGDSTRSPEPTAQDNGDFKQFDAMFFFCLLMFAFFAALFGNN